MIRSASFTAIPSPHTKSRPRSRACPWADNKWQGWLQFPVHPQNLLGAVPPPARCLFTGARDGTPTTPTAARTAQRFAQEPHDLFGQIAVLPSLTPDVGRG